MFKKIIILLIAVVAGIYLFNASWLTFGPSSGQTKLIAHRGVHQTFHREGLTNDTCTAERIDTPTHSYLENTLASMKAAFSAGADVVELDVHPTLDGKLVVFHDWTVDCRTEGKGETRAHTLAQLKALNIGHGYTADGGATYPFRVKTNEAMPELEEVLNAFPAKKFLVNFKGRDLKPANILLEKLKNHPGWEQQIWAVYGGAEPTRHASQNNLNISGFDKPQTKSCLKNYIALGWTGFLPAACRNTIITIPSNYTWIIWGWPNKFENRLRAHGSKLILSGPYNSKSSGGGIDTDELLKQIPKDFGGYILTNKIEIIGPKLKNPQGVNSASR